MMMRLPLPLRPMNVTGQVESRAGANTKGMHQPNGALYSKPLPTPCRAMRIPEMDVVTDCQQDSRSQSWSNTTLLDDSRRSWDEVCSAALTILDCSGSPSIDVAPQPIPLALADCLLPRTFDLTYSQAPIGRTLQDVYDLLGNMRVHLCAVLPDGIRLHPSTAQALQAIHRAPSHTRPDAFDVYCDGSFDGQISAWAIVVIGCVQGTPIDMSWASGLVCIDPTVNAWLGADAHGSLQAEESGVCHAILWAISAICGHDVSFNVDSMCAIMRARGIWRFHDNNRLAKTCRSLHQAAEAIGQINFETLAHVKAHASHPWNELADVLAKHAVSSKRVAMLPAPLNSWVQDSTIEHLWLLISTVKSPQLWPQHLYDCLVDYESVRFGNDFATADDLFTAQRGMQDRHSSQSLWQPLKLVTFNVQTLGEKEYPAPPDFEGRVAYLRAQMERNGVTIAALQETRTAKSESVTSGNFIRLCSGCDSRGQFGVELWFARNQAHGLAGFRAEDLIVVHWDCRVLCVKVRCPVMQALVVNVHAPTAQSVHREVA